MCNFTVEEVEIFTTVPLLNQDFFDFDELVIVAKGFFIAKKGFFKTIYKFHNSIILELNLICRLIV